MEIIMKLKKYYTKNPFIIILFSALILRLIAAIFAKGFSMFDDHFLVIEPAQDWATGGDDWFERGEAAGHSIVYPGLHFILFFLLEKFGITDPQAKMYFVRFFHAIYSMLTVWFGYRIAQRYSNEETANQVGLVLALFWIFPFMSVRNLIEVVCIPPMMIGFYLIVLARDKNNLKYLILSGIMFGLAFSFRYQTVLITGGVGLVFLFQNQWKSCIKYTVGFLMGAFIFQGIVDWVAWGYPFASFHSYVLYNIAHSTQYTTGPWFRYLLLILGVFVPPLSILLFYGFLKTWKKYAVLFFPTILFLVYHSYFPNKQERFILPILPLIIILGVIGWNEYIKTSDYWKKKKKLLNGFLLWFWILNSLLLITVTITYSKKARVETIYYISHKDDAKGVIIAGKGVPRPPKFYLNKNIPVYHFSSTKSIEQLQAEINESDRSWPNYIIFLGEKNINERVDKFENSFQIQLLLEKKVNPSLIDMILYMLNPRRNVNQTSYIYKTTS